MEKIRPIVFISMFGVMIACSSTSSPSGSTTSQTSTCADVGKSCTRGADMTSRTGNCCGETSNCVQGICKAASPAGSSCTVDDDCQDNSVCGSSSADGGAVDAGEIAGDAGAGGKVCVLAERCSKNGEYLCEGTDQVSICDGSTRTLVGACAQCAVAEYTTTSLADSASCNNNSIISYALAGYACDPTSEDRAACTFDHTASLTCRGGQWQVYSACSGNTPYCGHQLAGEYNCPTSAKDGCIGCMH
jgi:hypothetical protein